MLLIINNGQSNQPMGYPLGSVHSLEPVCQVTAVKTLDDAMKLAATEFSTIVVFGEPPSREAMEYLLTRLRK